MTQDIGQVFQEETKHLREQLVDSGLDWSTKPELYKEYPGSPKVELPRSVDIAGSSLDQALRMRKSVRRYADQPMPVEVLAYLLWASTGIQRVERDSEFRTAPSAGALYPVETYLVINNVASVPKGVYHYSIRRHALETLKPGDYADDLAEAAMGQRMCETSSVVFIWTGVFGRSTWKYRDRGYRYVYLDAGHVAENLALAATSIGLGSCGIAAIFDDEVNELIGVDGRDESAVYMSVVGYPAPA